jgi:hypothetical protein
MRCKIPARDLALKLNETICRYRKEPVWVRVLDEMIYLYKLDEVNSSGRYFAIIKPNDPDFDVAGVPLGYLQGESIYKHRVYYLSRIPIRKVKQGLPLNAIKAVQVGQEDTGPRLKLPFSPLTKSFICMVKNEYPKLADLMKMLRGLHAKDSTQIYQAAVSRDVAIEINQMGIINVYYKKVFVGWMQPDKNTVHIPKSELSWVISKYLSELDWIVD